MDYKDSLQQRQNDEIVAIKATYTKEVEDLRKNSSDPLEVIITTTQPENAANSKEEITTQADLYIKCCDDYPNSAPFMDVRNTKGLSVNDVSELKQGLESVAEQSIGQEMLLQLIQYTRTFLRNHEKSHHQSLYDEMVHNNLIQKMHEEKEQEEEKMAQEVEENKKLQAIEEEKNRKLKALEDACAKPKQSLPCVRQKSFSDSNCTEINPVHITLPEKLEMKIPEKQTESVNDSHESDGSVNDSHKSGGSVNDSDEIDESTYGLRLTNEYEILGFIGEGSFGSVYKVKNKLDSRLYAIKKIPLNRSDEKLNTKMKREVTLLSRLNHENVVRYYNSWVEKIPVPIDSATSSKTGFPRETNSSFAARSRIQRGMCGSNSNEEDGSSSDEDDENDVGAALEPNAGSVVSEEAPSASLQECEIASIMFIQMQWCENNTLRTAIDNNKVHTETSHVWRLFREIIEGLNYIHQQGIIHRDLKPRNIFLDSEDHVKIGDFGLAKDVISKPIFPCIPITTEKNYRYQQSLYEGNVDNTLEGNLHTADVGTLMYRAPEVINSSTSKASYNEKADIYSLGIIFFEMCYPFETCHERMDLLENLRKPDILLPPNVEAHLSPNMITILRWLLQHDVSKRPTANELILSGIIPSLPREETEIHNVLDNTVSNPQSRTYKYLIDCLFNQNVSTELDFTYDMEIYEGTSMRNKPTHLFTNVVDTLNKIFRKHGAVNYSVRTLMPKSLAYQNDMCVTVMDHGGGMISLPYDLGIPFARHIARKAISELKRFTLEKVYREQMVFGCHPREQFRYAFDIVTPSKYFLIPDAEVLTAVCEIITEFPSLKERDYFIRLNHTCLLKSVFLFCGVQESTENIVDEILSDQKNRNLSKHQLKHLLLESKIPGEVVEKLSQFIEVPYHPNEFASSLQSLTKIRGEVGRLAKVALNELEQVIDHAKSFGVNLPLRVCPCLTHEIKLYSGISFQFVCNVKLKKKTVVDVLAAGGRYDDLIQSFKLKSLSEEKSFGQAAVGVSIAVEKIVLIEKNYNQKHKTGENIDYLIYSSDSEMAPEITTLLKELWSLGFTASLFYNEQSNFDDAVDHCRNNSIAHLVILRSAEPGIVEICSFEGAKIKEKKMGNSDFRLYLRKHENLKSSTEFPPPFKSSEGRKRNFSAPQNSSETMRVRFLTADKIHKKRELNIRSHVVSTIQPNATRTYEIIVLDLKLDVIQSIMHHYDICASKESIEKAISIVCDLHSENEECLLLLRQEISVIKAKNPFSSIVLYSLPDNNFSVIL